MLDSTEQEIVGNIARVGWSLICVPEDEQGPSFVYSVGMMHTLEHPEIIMFGLDLDFMYAVINVVGNEIRAGREFRQPGLYDGLLEGFACKFKPVDGSLHREYLGCAIWHRRYIGQAGTLQAVQCLWPDMKGLFPDEPGCDPELIQLQPLLHHS